jgi:hypothetical protein
MMNATIPADLLGLKARFDQWRATRKYIRRNYSRSKFSLCVFAS